ncbi:MAG: ATP-binding cassette domain-containing protein [Anaerolineae bacterium]|nr:ATP-binding cassette domain-containing protein [Anaerolineae bacterium]
MVGVRLEQVCVALGEFRLGELTLEVAAGEYFVVLGPSGAGKTVLLETIAGIHRPCRGRIFIDGRDVTDLPPEKRGVGFVYQDSALFPHLNVFENVAFGLRLRGGRQVEEQVRAVSRLLDIEHLLLRRPERLSGGERQRVALARALVIAPRLLLLDEPLGALDPASRGALQRELAGLHGSLKTTIIHVTHDFEEAVALGERIAILQQGRVVQVGTPEEVFRRPNSEFVARFVGARNIFKGELRPAEDGYKVLSVGGIAIAVVTGLVGQVHGSLRPEDIIISREPFRSSVRNSFPGRITNIADRGSVIYVTVCLSEGPAPLELACAITRRSLEEMELREGEEVYIAFKASAVHVFPGA